MAASGTTARSRTKPADPEPTPEPTDEALPADVIPIYRHDGTVVGLVPHSLLLAGPTVPVDGIVMVPKHQASIHVLMGLILGELPAIGKNQRNVEQKFNFRGIDDVLNALNPLLAKYGVFYVPEVLERVADKRTTSRGSTMYEINLHVRYTFYGPQGDSVVASSWGEGTDMGDKSTNKAMTGAMKQALFQAFAIATEETRDQDVDRHPVEETVDPDANARAAGWADEAERAKKHEQLSGSLRRNMNDGLLTEADGQALKDLNFGWPMTKPNYDEYVKNALDRVEAAKAARAAESSQDEGTTPDEAAS